MIRTPTKTIADVEQNVAAKPDMREQAKELVAERASNGLYLLRFTAGGELPDVLKGYWTSKAKADQEATSYLAIRNAPTAS